ncbi:hypothetical protein Hanom_Chr11g01033791 [Helianthus anomalus]
MFSLALRIMNCNYINLIDIVKSSYHSYRCENVRVHDHISPHSAIMQGNLGRLFGPVATFSIFLITKRPSPRTLCINNQQY